MGRADNDAFDSTIGFSDFDMADVADDVILPRWRHAAATPNGYPCECCQRRKHAVRIGKTTLNAESYGRGWHIGLSVDMDSTN